jgi:hypothetical protein
MQFIKTFELNHEKPLLAQALPPLAQSLSYSYERKLSFAVNDQM